MKTNMNQYKTISERKKREKAGKDAAEKKSQREKNMFEKKSIKYELNQRWLADPIRSRF